MQFPIHKMLFQNQSKVGLVLSVLGCFIAIVSLAFSVLFYQDLSDITGENNKDAGYQYLPINKEIGYMNTIGLSSIEFRDSELEEIESQEFITAIGPVYSNNFKVSVSIGPLYTDIFLQSVPNDFLDVDTVSFQWKEGDEEVPIVISNHFYNLLNHGFGPSQGIPPLPKSVLKTKAGKLIIKGENGKTNLMCRIVGFSDRISSVLVPKSFLDWGNSRYSSNSVGKVSMILLKVQDSSDPRLEHFLSSKSYSVNMEQLIKDKSRLILQAITGLIVAFGLILLSISLVVIIQMIRLVIADNQASLQLLHVLGYSSNALRKYMWKGFVSVLIALFVLSVVGLVIVKILFHNAIEAFNFVPEANYLWPALIVVASVGLIALLMNLRLSASLQKIELNKV